MSLSLNEYLAELGMFGIKLNLEQTAELLERAGHPEKKLRFLHIAGSNGKGSCGAMLERALRSCGYRTGFYSSPHLLFLGERFRVDGRALSMIELEDSARELILQAEEMKKLGRCPTYFEFTTVLAAKVFAAEKVDFVVWETGMGGRLDATNAVTPVLSLITNISLEHTQYLGTTLPKIAFEKAGIIKKGKPVFLGEMQRGLRILFESVAGERGSEIHEADPVGPFRYGEVDGRKCQFFDWHGHLTALPLPGKMQRHNFAVSALALEYLAKEFGFDLGQALAGLSHVTWPGRCQILDDRTIVDGGHNPDGVRNLASVLAELYPGEKFCVVFGSFSDKDTRSVLVEAAKFAGEFIFAPLRAVGRPSRAPQELSELLSEVAPGMPSRTAESVTQALEIASSSRYRTLGAGSLYLVGEALEAKGKTFTLEQL